MKSEVSLYEAKTHLSALIERAAGGEEIVITRRGEARAKLVPVPAPAAGKRVFGQNLMGITYVADDFDAQDPEIIALFEGSEDDPDE